VKAIEPVNLVLSVPPNAIEPLTSSSVVVGSKEMPMELVVIVPWLKRLSVTVGMRVEPDERVPSVRSTGPILIERCQMESGL
jgi:hypothetical protein